MSFIPKIQKSICIAILGITGHAFAVTISKDVVTLKCPDGAPYSVPSSKIVNKSNLPVSYYLTEAPNYIIFGEKVGKQLMPPYYLSIKNNYNFFSDTTEDYPYIIKYCSGTTDILGNTTWILEGGWGSSAIFLVKSADGTTLIAKIKGWYHTYDQIIFKTFYISLSGTDYLTQTPSEIPITQDLAHIMEISDSNISVSITSDPSDSELDNRVIYDVDVKHGPVPPPPPPPPRLSLEQSKFNSVTKTKFCTFNATLNQTSGTISDGDIDIAGGTMENINCSGLTCKIVFSTPLLSHPNITFTNKRLHLSITASSDCKRAI